MKDDDERLPIPDENPDLETVIFAGQEELINKDIKVFIQGIASACSTNI